MFNLFTEIISIHPQPTAKFDKEEVPFSINSFPCENFKDKNLFLFTKLKKYFPTSVSKVLISTRIDVWEVVLIQISAKKSNAILKKRTHHKILPCLYSSIIKFKCFFMRLSAQKFLMSVSIKMKTLLESVSLMLVGKILSLSHVESTFSSLDCSFLRKSITSHTC